MTTSTGRRRACCTPPQRLWPPPQRSHDAIPCAPNPNPNARLSCSPNGKHLAVPVDNRCVKIYNVNGGRVARTPRRNRRVREDVPARAVRGWCGANQRAVADNVFRVPLLCRDIAALSRRLPGRTTTRCCPAALTGWWDAVPSEMSPSTVRVGGPRGSPWPSAPLSTGVPLAAQGTWAGNRPQDARGLCHCRGVISLGDPWGVLLGRRD